MAPTKKIKGLGLVGKVTAPLRLAVAPRRTIIVAPRTQRVMVKKK